MGRGVYCLERAAAGELINGLGCMYAVMSSLDIDELCNRSDRLNNAICNAKLEVSPAQRATHLNEPKFDFAVDLTKNVKSTRPGNNSVVISDQLQSTNYYLYLLYR